jgi:hypothetical protein
MIEDILSVCNLDYAEEKCAPMREILNRYKVKSCPYRFYYEKTGLFYCKWEMENIFVDVRGKNGYKTGNK